MTRPALSEADLATRGSGIRLLAEVGGRVLSLAMSFLVAVGLGVSGFGAFTTAAGLAVILAEGGDLGLQATAARDLVARTFRLASFVRARLVLTVAVGLLALSLPAIVPRLAPYLSTAGGSWAALLTPLMLYFLFANWCEFLGVALRARGRRVEEAVVLLLLRGSGLAAVAVALRGGTDPLRVAWAHAVSTAVPLVLGAFLLWRHPEAEPGPAAPIPQVLRRALPLALNGGLALISLRIELLAIFFLKGAAAAGLFGAALKVIESLNGIPSAITGGAMPSLTREALATLSAPAEVRAVQAAGGPVRERLAGTVALLAVPAATGLAVAAPALVGLLGAGYEGAAAPLRVLAAAVVPMFLNVVLLHALIAIGHASWLPRLTARRVAAAVLLAALLIPPFGAMGAAAGFLISELALLALAARGCVASRFAVPLLGPVALGAAFSGPMAAALVLADGGPASAVVTGVLTYAVTVVAAWRLWPELLRAVGLRGETGGRP